MPKMIQIRHVPDDLHRTLKVRAAEAGTSLSDYLLDELRRTAARPTANEMLERLRRRKPVTLSRPVAEWVREQHDARTLG